MLLDSLMLLKNTLFMRRKCNWTDSFYNRHIGQKAVIIGNGPSVDTFELERLGNCITFAMNRFHLCYSATSFRPNYTVVVDNQMLADFGHEIVKNSVKPIFVSNYSLSKKTKESYFIPLLNVNQFQFRSLHLSKYLHSGDSVVITAIQLAWLMGIKEIFLYGVDHRFDFNKTCKETGKVTGGSNHFIPNYRGGKAWYPPKIDVIEEAFSACQEFIENQGGELINLTPNTSLDCVKKGSLNKFLETKCEYY
jgi:hypothetical protein